MFEQSRTILKSAPARKVASGCKQAAKNQRIAKELEGTITLEEYRQLLIRAYHSLHKDENI